MPIARIIGANASVGNKQIELESPSLINCYSNIMGGVTKVPGLGLVHTTTSSAPITGIYNWTSANQVIVTQADGTLSRIDNTGVTQLSSPNVKCGSQPATFAEAQRLDGARVLFIATGDYLITLGASESSGGADKVGGDSPQKCSHVVSYDGHILGNLIGTARIYYTTDPSDPTSWSEDAYIEAEYASDNIVALHVFYHELMLVGTNSIEFWYNTGTGSLDPFSPIEGAQMDIGIIAQYSIISVNNIPYFLTRDRKFCRLIGRQIEVLSGSIQAAIDGIEVGTDARSCKIYDNGQTFIALTFPTSRETWVFNTTTNRWSQWGEYSESSDTFDMVKFLVSDLIIDSTFGDDSAKREKTFPSDVSTVPALGGSDWAGTSSLQGTPSASTEYATVTMSGSQASYVLKTQGYGFNIPLESTVTGVRVLISFFNGPSPENIPADQISGDTIRFAVPFNSVFKEKTAYLALDGTALTGVTNRASFGRPLTSLSRIEYGGDYDLWGARKITPDTVNDPKFGVTWQVESTGSGTMNVRAINVTVFYVTSSQQSTTSKTWVGDSSSGRVFEVSSAHTSNVYDGVLKTPIRVRIDSGHLNYNTLKRKFSQSFDMRVSPNSGKFTLRWNDDTRDKWCNPITYDSNPGIIKGQRMGMYFTRQYRIEHSCDSEFTFIEGEETVTFSRL